MRASELIRAEVIDRDGTSLGRVEDLRVVQDGPLIDGFGAALRLDGLVVGTATLATRLGYHRHGIGGPALLKALFGAIERRAHYVTWDLVDRVEDRVVRLSVAADDVPRLDAAGG